jgi:hypothetical protein
MNVIFEASKEVEICGSKNWVVLWAEERTMLPVLSNAYMEEKFQQHFYGVKLPWHFSERF